MRKRIKRAARASRFFNNALNEIYNAIVMFSLLSLHNSVAKARRGALAAARPGDRKRPNFDPPRAAQIAPVARLFT